MGLSANLKEARLKKGLTQEDLANLIGKTKNVISNWERGDNKPDADTLFFLCDILDVDANFLLGWDKNENLSLSLKEQDYIKKYRELDEHGTKIVDFVLNGEYERCKETSINLNTILKPNYQCGLSAGTGMYVFDDIPTNQIEVPIEYDYIDFVINVRGDSMEPTYSNDDKVMIVKKENINIGEIGAFMINGEAYIKELGANGLISHNKKYPLIEFKEDMRIDCIGKVIGKLIE